MKINKKYYYNNLLETSSCQAIERIKDSLLLNSESNTRSKYPQENLRVLIKNRDRLNLKKVPLYLLICSVGFVSCKKFVTIDAPTTSVTSGNVFNTDATAIAVLNGLFSKMSGTSATDFDVTTLAFWTGLTGDELALWNGVDNSKQIAYYNNKLMENPISSVGSEFWFAIYRNIFSCNAAIEGLDQAENLTPLVKQQLLGESKFLRAFFYFNLINLFGDVPLALSTDYKVNSGLPRSSKSQVYQQIIVDLIEAKSLLNDKYLQGNAWTRYQIGQEERVRPTKAAARALLARVYLYINNWVDAEHNSTEIINDASLYSLSSLDAVFLRNNSEAIWQLQPVDNYITNTNDGNLFVLPSAGPNSYPGNPVFLSDYQISCFESNDQRKMKWINSVSVNHEIFYYPFKYKENIPDAPLTEYLMMFRLGEQYLIRAEARAQLDNISGAQSDLNAIRNRAGLSDTQANDKTSLLKAILNERQVELFTESGHRWFDLKRTGKVDEVMSIVTPEKGGTWNTNWQLYPIPLGDIQKNSNLRQNQGY
jgi:hypothetical protein